MSLSVWKHTSMIVNTDESTNIMLTDKGLIDDTGIDDQTQRTTKFPTTTKTSTTAKTPTTTTPHGYTPLAETPKWGLGPHVSELASAAACAEH